MLAPVSVAVIGARRHPGSVAGSSCRTSSPAASRALFPVNPHAAKLDGVPCVPSAAVLPNHVDLAIIATPPAAVLGIAEDCGSGESRPWS